ncbi:hypothetical protein D9Q98_005285 [Chlorella vulgaris]|uniref:Uncharacterized protein n=1 Tax=Chlorella vulgaris TaxID=3077 RepID=A0A9D4TNX7_CHLVU|nr:hypothetical protein D9Q98_005285 [Chlorella vulgaris]
MSARALATNPTTAACRLAVQPRRLHRLPAPSAQCKHRAIPDAAFAGSRRVQAAATSNRQPPSRADSLQDPAKLVGSKNMSVKVLDRGGEVSLEKYMLLPTDQYNELDPQMIKSLGGSTFLLKVPRLTLFNVWVEPAVTMSVRVADDQRSVVFESGDCRLNGSDLLNQLGLDKRFVLSFHTVLTWQPGAAATSPAAASNNGSTANQGTIFAKAEVSVLTEVIGPFKAIPRGMLVGTGNAVMAPLMNTLLPIFMNKLADDYGRWSTDPTYRARRAAASATSQQQQQQQLQPQRK